MRRPRKWQGHAPPQTPGILALSPATEVPPITTTAIEVSRYSLTEYDVEIIDKTIPGVDG